DQTAGKVVVLVAPRGGGGGRGGRGANPAAQFPNAAAIVMVGGEQLSPQQIAALRQPSIGLKVSNEVPGTINVTTSTAQKLLGVPSLDGLAKGTIGKTVHGAIVFDEIPAPTRNVVALLPGSDPKLRGEYVAIGAHSDHIGMRPAGVDKDSLRAYNTAREAITMSLTNGQRATPEQLSMIKVNMDSIRKLYPVARRDSINNGADDDGSGSMAVLEIAEAFAKSSAKPKRSILFVWHTGEEKGLLGSRWFTDHPTVERDSIVAQLNIDMIGRGGTADALVGTTKEGEHVKGTPDYLELVGSRRLSTELGDMVETVNTDKKLGLTFDYTMDANGHPENIYCRSDHANYARFGIPIVFFTTGLHKDYHQLTDEPQLIDYPHFARVTQLVYDMAQRVANLDHRVVVDKPKPDPTAACRQ
ncbi:MAG: M20/M25/M40 family metallo-hydrolase, partial [Gemmatimonadota bacterium]|nr:M20/M25/M40 family metallo-hydrolase [Gemmatimonadota bacterium]